MLKRETAQAMLADFEVADWAERRRKEFAQLPEGLQKTATDIGWAMPETTKWLKEAFVRQASLRLTSDHNYSKLFFQKLVRPFSMPMSGYCQRCLTKVAMRGGLFALIS
ncbi:MAG: hypothetical protein AAFV90_11870 [Cyanobacteria bacterium J06634_5]